MIKFSGIIACLTSFSHIPILQQTLAKSTPYEGATRTYGFMCAQVDLWRQAGVNFDEIHGNEAAGLVDALADVVALTQRQATAHRCARGRRPHGVESIDVK